MNHLKIYPYSRLKKITVVIFLSIFCLVASISQFIALSGYSYYLSDYSNIISVQDIDRSKQFLLVLLALSSWIISVSLYPNYNAIGYMFFALLFIIILKTLSYLLMIMILNYGDTKWKFPTVNMLLSRFKEIQAGKNSEENSYYLSIKKDHDNVKLTLLNHKCSLSANSKESFAEYIHREVFNFTIDLSWRIECILSLSFFLGFISIYVPIIHFQYEKILTLTKWHFNFTLTATLTIILFCSISILPLDYLVEHKYLTEHLGHWMAMGEGEVKSYRDSKNSTNKKPSTILLWSSHNSYKKDAVVRHKGIYYQSTGEENCSEPGNYLHKIYYVVFSSPTQIYLTSTMVSFLNIAWPLSLLQDNHHCFFIFPIAVLILFNLYIFYLYLRTSFILLKISKRIAKK